MSATPEPCEIVPYSAELAHYFRDLNIEWLEQYFVVEPIDERVLASPQHIIDAGGMIFFARSGNQIIGTCALKVDEDGAIELTKMAVTQAAQGKGAGRALLRAGIDWFRRQEAKTLFLESHSSLAAAVHLYETAGFAHVTRPRPSEYARSDVYMVWMAENG